MLATQFQEMLADVEGASQHLTLVHTFSFVLTFLLRFTNIITRHRLHTLKNQEVKKIPQTIIHDQLPYYFEKDS